MTRKEVDIGAERKNTYQNIKDNLVRSFANEFRNAFNSHDPEVFPLF